MLTRKQIQLLEFIQNRMLRDGVRPTRGKLTFAFANVEAFSRFDPANPYATRFVDEVCGRCPVRCIDEPARLVREPYFAPRHPAKKR